jgi:DNA-binding response OmpR family regulator
MHDPARQTSVPVAPAGPRVLVVEDDEATRAVVSEALCDEGYQVLTAADGQDALEICGTRCPDLILLDLSLPRLNGPSFLQTHRKQHICGARVVVMTARSNARAIAHAMQADAVIIKPFVISELTATVRRHTIPSAA